MLFRARLSAALSLLALSAAAQAAPMPSQMPPGARPVHYAITITPNAAKLAFTAAARIDIDIQAPTRTLTLNAADLAISRAAIGAQQATVTLNAEAQTATFTFPKPLKTGRARLDLTYAGKIQTQANGLFALDYQNDDGKDARAVFTQFEAPDARRFAPTWDEPNFKATFDLTAIVPADQIAVSNMPAARSRPLAGGLKEVTFQRTPRMSTYLLFFAAGDFERITKKAGATDIGVVTVKGHSEKGRFALNAAADIVPYYNDYFAVPYPLPKLDNVAAPGASQFFGAMENWGAILTFERVLLVDPKLTTARQKQNIYVTAAHEIAHQWFGNLDTMSWWDDLWLNEGFASWMETKATAHFNPEWQADLDRIDGREGAMALDGLKSTHPIVQTIRTVEETNQAFDEITYSKGEAVITMLEGFAGEDVWRNGIRAYIKRHAYANTTTDDLWAAVEGAGPKGLSAVAHDFTRQPGIPLIRVGASACVNGQTQVRLSQGEFSRDRKPETDAKPQAWRVPITAATLGSAPARAIISDAGDITAPGCGPLIINAGQTGYFRTLYNAEQLQALRGGFAKLSPKDQLGLMHDALALSQAGYQPMGPALDLIAAVGVEASPKVQTGAIYAWQDLYEKLRGDDDAQGQIAAIASRQFAPVLARVGLDPKPDEKLLDTTLRASLIGALGAMGDPTVRAAARARFAALQKDPAALDGPLRQTWLRIIARNADRATWDALRAQGRSADTAMTKSTLYGLLGLTTDPALAQATLDLALTPEPGATVSAAMIYAVSVHHPDRAVDFALANKAKIAPLVDASARSEFVARLAADSRDPAMTAKLDAYAKSDLTPDSRAVVDRAINALNARAASEPRIRAETKAWLAGRG